MANSYKVLGQATPANTNNTNLYTVPAATQAVVSTLVVSNVSGGAIVSNDYVSSTCRIFVRVNGAEPSIGNALIYNGEVFPGDFTAITIGITLSAGDIITVQSSVANTLTFQAFGSEIA